MFNIKGTPMSLSVICVLFLFWTCVSAVTISQTLSSGVCLCVNEPNVPAITDPGDLSTVVATLESGRCFQTHGGIYHEDSITFYELVDEGQTAWVDSFYLSVSSTSVCNNSTVTPNYHTPEGQATGCTTHGKSYIHGETFSVHGLHCTCDDGATLCTMTGDNCFSGGIVYKHGTSFEIAGRGSCTCIDGHVQCTSSPAVGK